MNEITEYRQKSAEALELPNWRTNKSDMVIYDADRFGVNWTEWQPDKDANQREMIEDWLIEQGYNIVFDYYDPSGDGEKVWIVSFQIPRIDHFEGQNKSKSEAFRKAFMEYINQTK